MLNERSAALHAPRAPRWLVPLGAAAAVVALAVLFVIPSVGGLLAGGDTSGTVEEAQQEAPVASYAPLDPENLAALEGSTEIASFSLVEGQSAPELSGEARSAIQASLDAIAAKGGCEAGFLLLDIEGGQGVSYNVDERFYGASSFKGPYCAYVSEHYLEGDEDAPSVSKSFSLNDLVYNTIVYSNNETYSAMRSGYSDVRLEAWLTSIDVDPDLATDTFFPTYSTREAAKLWLATYEYLASGSKAANTLSSLMGATKTSFMRAALVEGEEDAGEGDPTTDAPIETRALGTEVSDILAKAIEEATREDIVVRDKAGWFPQDDNDIPAIVDSGIVTCNGRDYLLCVMTDLPYATSNADLAQELIASVFATHSELAPVQA